MPVLENSVSNGLNSALAEYLPAALDKMDPGMWRQIFPSRSDGRSAVVLSGVAASGRFQEQPIGQPTPEGTIFERGSVTLTAVRFSAKQVFDGKTLAEVEAAKNGDLQQLCVDWASSNERTHDLRASSFLRSTATTTYDAKALYATDHPQKSKSASGDTFSNTIEDAAYSVTDENIKLLLARFEETNAVGENGEKITWKATDIVATNHADYYAALTVLKSIGRAGTANNDINAIQIANQGLNVFEWRELTPTSGTTRYLHVFNTRPGENGMRHIEQSPLMTSAWYDPDADQYFMRAAASGSFGNVNWRSTARIKTVA